VLGGRYRLVSRIARGGMADVWEGYDAVLSRAVAVKMLKEHLAEDGLFLERFRREAVTAARLAHPGIVATYDTGVDAGTSYIVMELVSGRTLRQLLEEQGPLTVPVTIGIAGQIADALAYAHRCGLVHRDVKPANVLLSDDGWGVPRVKVTDFGIAKAGERLGQDLTGTGIVLGTPKYLSPEQIQGQEPDARADLYALGVLIYEMLAGEPPFAGPTDVATAMAHINAQPQPIRRPDMPPSVARIVSGLLAKNPADRVPSAVALRQSLAAVAATIRGSASPPGGPGAPASAVAGVVGMPPGANGQRLTSASGSPTRSDPTLRPVSPPGADPATRPGPPARADPATRQDPAVRSDSASRPVGAPGPRPDPRSTPLRSSGGGRLPSPPAAARSAPTRRRRANRGVGLVVAGLALVGLILVGVLLLQSAGSSSSDTAARSVTTGPSLAVRSVSVFMADARAPDDPSGTKYTIENDPNSAWHTDVYGTPTFGGLYDGIGLAIDLGALRTLHSLSVTSSSLGWSAQTYVSVNPVPSGQEPTAWGPATAVQTGVNGDATFNLGGRKGRYVLLWLTYLGPAKQVSVTHVTVR
jgi:serine/threonine protein kinase